MWRAHSVIRILMFIIPVVLAHAQQKDNLSLFLQPTENVNSDHPNIMHKAEELTRDLQNDADKARLLFEFVRDSYNDNPSGSFRASDILDYGGNNCIRRSILLVALCRAVGIPARLHMQEFMMKKETPGSDEVEYLRSPHVITGIYLNGNWRLYDATGNEKKWVGLNQDPSVASQMPLEFYADRDCLFPSNDRVTFTKSLIYFSDWSETHEDLKNRIARGNVGFIYH
jgi:transglutaminase-like putative cysteine protease